MKSLAGAFWSLAWVLFRARAGSRELDQNLKAVRWTVALTHAAALGGLSWYALSHPVLALAGLALVVASLAGLIVQYRRLARALREELVRSVMES